jgi:hypothetical protein
MAFSSLILISTLILGNILISDAKGNSSHFGEQPLSRIAIHKSEFVLHKSAYINVSPVLLGLEVTSLHFDIFDCRICDFLVVLLY